MHAIREINVVRKLLLACPGIEDEANILDLVAHAGALLEGHFALQGGGHSQYFLRFKPLGWDRNVADGIANALLRLAGKWCPAVPASVICPESAGVFLGAAIARMRGFDLVVAQIDSARRPTAVLRTGAPKTGQPVLIVNDVITTGASLQPLQKLAADHQAPVAGTMVFACKNTDDWRHSLREKHQEGASLFATRWQIYPPQECPRCAVKEDLVPATEFN